MLLGLNGLAVEELALIFAPWRLDRACRTKQITCTSADHRAVTTLGACQVVVHGSACLVEKINHRGHKPHDVFAAVIFSASQRVCIPQMDSLCQGRGH